MLIFISELHFVDGSAGQHNVPADGFRIFLRTFLEYVTGFPGRGEG